MIIGAGVAGLAAARKLIHAGARVVILEARDRIGGRLLTLHEPGLSVPIELGAEFVHAEAEETRDVARQAGIAVTDLGGQRMQSRDGRLRPMPGFEKKLHQVMARLDGDADPDRPFAEALRRLRLPPETKRLATRFVEGFHGADAALVSERFLAGSADDEEALRIARVDGGYDGIVNAIASTVTQNLRLSHIVTRVRWKAGRVEVESEAASGRRRPDIRARAAIVAVPWGVLTARAGQKGRIEFEPALDVVEDYSSRLTMGGVRRVVLHFDEPVWLSPRFAHQQGRRNLRSLTFIQSLSPIPFPVWWTTYPVEAPVLVAWSGGPDAWSMQGRSKRRIVETAMTSLAQMTGITRATLKRHLVGSHTHDWLSDPFSRGAYSYACVGGAQSATVLARPLQQTIFIAGEHASAGRNGTVDGAIASGERAADQVLRIS